MDPVERYSAILGVSPGIPATEMERAYVSLLQELNSRQAALAGDPEAQDAIEQRMREVMEAYAYLARRYEMDSVLARKEEEVLGKETIAAEQRIMENGEDQPEEPEPPKLVSDLQLMLLFRFAGGLLLCALLAIVLARGIARRAVTESPIAPDAGLAVSGADQAVQSTASAAAPTVGERKEGEKRTTPKAARSRGRAPMNGDFPLKGRVVSITTGGEYSYLLIGFPRGQAWVALPRTATVHIGDRFESADTPQVLNYHSSILPRTVDRIIFPSAVRINGRELRHGQAGRLEGQ